MLVFLCFWCAFSPGCCEFGWQNKCSRWPGQTRLWYCVECAGKLYTQSVSCRSALDLGFVLHTLVLLATSGMLRRTHIVKCLGVADDVSFTVRCSCVYRRRSRWFTSPGLSWCRRQISSDTAASRSIVEGYDWLRWCQRRQKDGGRRSQSVWEGWSGPSFEACRYYATDTHDLMFIKFSLSPSTTHGLAPFR